MTAEQWQRLNELFDAAIALEPSARPDFAVSNCGDDPELLAELRKLLQAHDEAASFIGQPAAGDALRILSDREPHSPSEQEFASGERLGRYEIIRQIGQGGMGEVFLAHDSTLGRDVAIKVLLGDVLSDPNRVRRFRLEAKAASALNHPNILTIYEIGDDQTVFIASEFIKGKTLGEYRGNEALAPEHAVRIALQVVSALAAAHQHGIVHRDIKPDNIMIRDDEIVKVLDFGLAKLTEKEISSGAEERTLAYQTQPGLIMGTPRYMSPEQARGQVVDAQSDIFSFGVVLYEMLTGKLPFDGETTSDVIAAVLTYDPPSVSVLRPEVPSTLVAIVSRALERDRLSRYQSTHELLLDLREVSDELIAQNRLERTLTPDRTDEPTMVLGMATSATQTPLGTEITTPKRNRTGFWLAGLFLSILAIGGAVFGYLGFRGQKQFKSIAVMPFANSGGNADTELISDGMTESLIRNLSNLPELDVKASSSVFRYKGSANDLRSISRELGAEVILTGRFVDRGSRINLYLELVDPDSLSVIWKEQYDRAQSELVVLQSDVARDVSAKLRQRLSGTDTKRVTDIGTTNSEAYEAYLKGRYFLAKAGPDSPQQSLHYFQEAVALDSQFAQAYAGIADAYTLIGTLMHTRVLPSETMPQAKAAAEKAVELNPGLSEAYVSRAWIKFRYDWDWIGAESDFKRAIELNPNNSQAFQWYGELLAAQRRDEEAIATMRRARDLEPFSVLMNWNYAKLFRDFGRYEESIGNDKVYEMDPSFTRIYPVLRIASAKLGRENDAFSAFLKERELSGDPPEKTEFYRKLFKEKGYQVVIREWLTDLLKDQQYISPSAKAVYYANLEEKKRRYSGWKRVSDYVTPVFFPASSQRMTLFAMNPVTKR